MILSFVMITSQIDDRNQFDLTRSLPGGVKGLRVAVDTLHAAGVRNVLPSVACVRAGGDR